MSEPNTGALQADVGEVASVTVHEGVAVLSAEALHRLRAEPAWRLILVRQARAHGFSHAAVELP